MPLKHFHCPDQPLNWKDINECRQCKERCLPLPLLKALWQDEIIGDPSHYHNDPKSISVTTTQGCLLEAYLKRTTEFAEDPAKLIARWQGTLIHAAIERSNQDKADGISELRMSKDLSRGYTLDGAADWVDDSVADFKTVPGPRKTYSDGNATQLAIYKPMAEAELNKELGEGRVWMLHRKGCSCHTVHDVPEALERCIERAELLIDAIVSEDPSGIPRDGQDVRMHSWHLCQSCVFTDECLGYGGPDERSK